MITDTALSILERYCQDEINNNIGMNILNTLLVYRIPIQEKCLNILFNIINNENKLIRNNTINLLKNLHKKNQLKKLIEVRFDFSKNYFLLN